MIDYLYFIFEVIAFITCAYCYKKLDKNFRIFLPFLTFIVVYEFANIRNWLMWNNSNAWCNNIEGLIELIVYGLFMASLDKRKTYKKNVYITIGAGVVFSLIDIFFIQGFRVLGTIGIVLQNTILAILVCIYYYNLINKSAEYLDLLKHPPFYATTGLLFYSLTNFFYYSAFGFMAYKNSYQFYILARSVTDIGCIFIYSLLAVSFLCFLRTKKLS